MHRQNINQLKKLHNVDVFMAATQVAKEMRRYLTTYKIEAKIMQIEDLEGSVVNHIKDIKEDEDASAEVVKTKIDKEARIKSMFVQTTQPHELLA